MNVYAIVIILASFLLGVLITYFIIKSKSDKTQPTTTKEVEGNTDKRSEELETKISALEKQYEESFKRAMESEKKASLKEEEIKELSETIASLKKKHAEALNTANTQIMELENQLSNSLSGNADDAIKSQLEELKALRRKVSSLEEEIEDNEDDIQDLEKKLSKKTSENYELQENYDKAERNIARLNKQLEEVQDTLKFQEHESAQNTEALSFVAEILQATPVSDQSKKALFNSVDALVSYVEDDLHNCLKGKISGEDEKKIFGEDLKAWAANKKKSWIQDKTTIAFVGDFSAGKTSIVNRILSQDQSDIPLLPVSTKATTAIPTYISEGIKNTYMFVSPNDEQKNISEKTFKRVNKEVLDRVEGLSSLIKYFVMMYENPNLNNLSILDTPGFSSNDKEDKERTIEVINECDALFWVVDVNAGTVNRSSLNLIKENLTKPLYIIINKVDTKAKSEVDAVEKLITNTFTEENVEINGFVRFSSKANLNDIMSVIKEVKRNDSKDTYMECLLQIVKDTIGACAKDVEKAKKECDKLFKSYNGITDKFYKGLDSLGKHCNKVENIPRFTEHLFKKDNYEMSQEEYEQLVDILQKMLYEDCPNLVEIYDESSEEIKKFNDAWHVYSDKMKESAKLEDCYEQLEKKNKRLMKLSYGK